MYPVIPISRSIEIPTYYLVLSATICVCLLWLTKRSARFGLSRKLTLDLSLIIMITGFVGSRLFHVFYEDFEYYRGHLWRIFEFWNGGFIFYGGALLAGFCSILYLSFKAHGQFESYLDLFAPVISFAYAMGRGACLLAGCCYGRYCDLPWAIEGRHPTQIYASLWELGVLFIIIGCEKVPRENRKPACLQNQGSIFYLWMILHAIGRLVMEAYRDDFRGPSLGLSISSWISIGVISLGLYLLFRRPTRGSSTRAS